MMNCYQTAFNFNLRRCTQDYPPARSVHRDSDGAQEPLGPGPRLADALNLGLNPVSFGPMLQQFRIADLGHSGGVVRVESAYLHSYLCLGPYPMHS